MKIFFDFDDVLFNTQAFVDENFKVFARYGVSAELYRETYVAARQLGNEWVKVYNMDAHLETLKDLVPGFDAESVRAGVEKTLSDTSHFVFPEVEACLRKLKERGCELYVISFGRPEFQRSKIQNSGLAPYLQGILAGLEMKSAMMQSVLGQESQGEDVWFVEDQVKFIQETKKVFPSMTMVQVARPEGRFNSERIPESDFLVHDVAGIPALLA